MNNPFDEEKEKEKYQFFEEVTKAIDSWMLEKYPDSDRNIKSKLTELEVFQNKIRDSLIQYEAWAAEKKDKLILYEEIYDMWIAFREFKTFMKKLKKDFKL